MSIRCRAVGNRAGVIPIPALDLRPQRVQERYLCTPAGSAIDLDPISAAPSGPRESGRIDERKAHRPPLGAVDGGLSPGGQPEDRASMSDWIRRNR